MYKISNAIIIIFLFCFFFFNICVFYQLPSDLKQPKNYLKKRNLIFFCLGLRGFYKKLCKPFGRHGSWLCNPLLIVNPRDRLVTIVQYRIKAGNNPSQALHKHENTDHMRMSRIVLAYSEAVNHNHIIYDVQTSATMAIGALQVNTQSHTSHWA